MMFSPSVPICVTRSRADEYSSQTIQIEFNYIVQHTLRYNNENNYIITKYATMKYVEI